MQIDNVFKSGTNQHLRVDYAEESIGPYVTLQVTNKSAAFHESATIALDVEQLCKLRSHIDQTISALQKTQEN